VTTVLNALTFAATPANLEARTQRFTLANGIKVALLPKKTRGQTVKVALAIDQGDEKSLFGTAAQGKLAAAMLARGTAKHGGRSDEHDRLAGGRPPPESSRAASGRRSGPPPTEGGGRLRAARFFPVQPGMTGDHETDRGHQPAPGPDAEPLAGAEVRHERGDKLDEDKESAADP